jgi:hypothetical protein
MRHQGESLCDHRFDLDADFTRAKRESDVGGISAADNHIVTVLRLGGLELLL